MSRSSTPDNAMMRKQQESDLGHLTEGELPPGSDGAQPVDQPHRIDGSDTEKALKQAVEKARQNRTVRRRG